MPLTARQFAGKPHDANIVAGSPHVPLLSGYVDCGAPLSTMHEHTFVFGSQSTS